LPVILIQLLPSLTTVVNLPPPDTNNTDDKVELFKGSTFEAFELTAPVPMFLIVIDLFVFKLAVGNVTVIVELLLSFKYITLYEVKSSTNDTLVPVLDIYKLALSLAVADNVPLVKDKPLPTVTPTTCPVLLLPITLVAVPDTDDKVTVPLNVLFPVNVSVHDLHAAPN
jgi:hypothetical protein